MHDHGTFTPASDKSASSPSSSDRPDLERPVFPTHRRGLDPAAVDAHLTRLEENAATLRTALEESERRRTMAEQHALAVEDEIRTVRAGLRSAPATPPSDTGFGARAERLLRLAESEADQIRTAARRSAAEANEQAANDAERHRHDVRQRLIAETARAEEQAAHRAAELQDRELALRTRMDRARAEADTIRSAAQRAAEAQRSAAEADVAALRNQSAQELRRVREREERELARLRDLQGVARRELVRLASLIRAELPPTIARPSPGPGAGAGSGSGRESGQAVPPGAGRDPGRGSRQDVGRHGSREPADDAGRRGATAVPEARTESPRSTTTPGTGATGGTPASTGPRGALRVHPDAAVAAATL